MHSLPFVDAINKEGDHINDNEVKQYGMWEDEFFEHISRE
jgi:hypothetical protein